MNFRIENKYKIDVLKIDELYNYFASNFAKVLYPRRKISSIYFDNNILSSYDESIEGIVPRKKIRLRTYTDKKIFDLKNVFNLEVKINSVEGRLKKITKDVDHLKLLNTGILDPIYGLMKPVIEVTYMREYYLIHNLRITLDTKINYKIFNKRKSTILNEEAILEIKSDNIDNLNYIDEKFNLMKTRYSKYSNAIENLQLA
jgi:hypothetical protein